VKTRRPAERIANLGAIWTCFQPVVNDPTKNGAKLRAGRSANEIRAAYELVETISAGQTRNKQPQAAEPMPGKRAVYKLPVPSRSLGAPIPR